MYNDLVVVELSQCGCDHVPVIPFVDVVGSGDKVSPEQIGPTALKPGSHT
jgi:hypothetical protein